MNILRRLTGGGLGRPVSGILNGDSPEEAPTMTRAVETASTSDPRTSNNLFDEGSCERTRACRESVAYLQAQGELQKLAAVTNPERASSAGGHSDSASVTSSLLGPASKFTGTVENRHSRRQRVTRSWTGGYGTLPDHSSCVSTGARAEAGADLGSGSCFMSAGSVRKVSSGNVPQQQFLRSLQRASSTILSNTSPSAKGNNNNNCGHNHNIVTSPYAASHGCLTDRTRSAACERVETADAVRRSRIDVLLMPSLKSLVSRRPAPDTSSRGGGGNKGGGGGGLGNAGAGAASSSGACDMGGSSSSGVATGAAHLKSKSAAAMVPLMNREASCGSLSPSVRVGGSADPLGCFVGDDVFAGGGSGSDSSSSSPRVVASHAAATRNIRKCETVLALSNLGGMLRSASSSRTTVHVEPLKPVNRLRVPPQSPVGGSTSRMCSRCSSLLSMASSSRYSLNTAGSFVTRAATPPAEPRTIICKLCLSEVPLTSTCHIQHCACCFCKDCMKTYVEFEIQEGAYDISCPDAQCDKQGVISMSEIENLVSVEMVEKHKKFRLNREVDLDVNRTWCPRAGCETICSICPTEPCQPRSVHCPTCTSDFCSNCKNQWHPGLTCDENSQHLAKEGMPDNMEAGIPFDSDLIKCCPMCNVPIEKDEGCAQMMCKRCKHVFCWYCLASLDDDFLLRHYDKGPCKNKLGHSRASVIWHRTQVIGIFAGFGILLLVASPLLLLAAPCIVCCKCRICSGGSKLDSEDEMPEESAS